MSGMRTQSLQWAIAKLAPHMAASASELNTADGKLGDGDLGITMDRGMAGLSEIGDELPLDLGLALLQCAKEFTKVSGSSFGTLFATGLMSAAKACKGNEKISWSKISPLLSAATEAMMKRGKGKLGDKTVLDTLDAMAKATNGLDTVDALLIASGKAVSQTMDKFCPLQSGLGRARMYGEKSVGLDDPGMLALKKIVEGLNSK